MNIKTCSHLVIATADVVRISGFFSSFFSITAHFENEWFCEFVLTSGFRIAFFKPTGKSAQYFSSDGARNQVSLGLTFKDTDSIYQKAIDPEWVRKGVTVSGPPKEHPWGEKSFLLIDPDGNRWEITESPSENGMLVNREKP
jgi:hypothetical protein